MKDFYSLIKGLKYKIIKGDVDNLKIENLVYDNRLDVKNAVFVCIKGAKFDTHSCLKELYDKGCRAFVVEREVPLLYLDDATIIKVENSRNALALMSIEYFDNPMKDLCIIGITGTKGKTSTSMMIKNILENANIKTGVIGTMGVSYNDKYINSGNTTPESFLLQKYFRLMVDDGITHVVMECSSQAFMMHRLDNVIYDYSIFTNITPDHIGENEHKDFEEYLFYKQKIFDNSKKSFINADSEHIDEILEYAKNKNTDFETYSIDKPSNYKITKIIHKQDDKFVGTEFVINDNETYDLDLPGKFNIYNAVSAICVCKSLNINDEIINESLSKIKINGRMELVVSNSKFKVIVDYAHNAVSMENLLKTLKEYEHKRIVIVFGCGGNRAVERRFGMGRVAAKYADLSILTADNSRFEDTKNIINDIKSTLVPEGGKYIEIDDRREAIKYAIKNAMQGDIIAVIGKGHEDYNEVNGVKTHFVDKEEILKAYNYE